MSLGNTTTEIAEVFKLTERSNGCKEEGAAEKVDSKLLLDIC